MRVRLLAVALGVATSFASERAHADEWYGWQTLTSDAITLGATVGVAAATDDAIVPIVVGATGFVVAPVAIHALHEQPEHAALSGGMRIVVPVGGMLLGGLAAADSGKYGLGSIFGGALGLALGILASSAVDAAVLARTN